ncbi:sulfatase-like hydrolase/transferase [Synoicihabitans lomoniglobus]|uniref:Sulfatase-like hydrolase/transferase n=1 Tax=Synoicihabitans lomoniglobus TaxID=2909285 RepID=A0AAF0CN20_9BACT|nr:sulfatase-like hydrolase/transferase [Opitutaceae bacterium LMO-M01]WED64056.1 sulfatase-like hydrolase/transferase [Opitutaceae bacterium LMO-M01]
MNRAPNILLIHSDQHRQDCLGINGHSLVHTPHLDQLAGEGVNFTHAFTPSPICSPARASLLTGTWPTTHGCINIEHMEGYQPARRDLPNLWHLLADAGFRQALVGKFHGEVAGAPADHGVDDAILRDGYDRWREAQGIPPIEVVNGWFGDVDRAITPAQSRVAWLTDQALSLMRRYHGEARPFFIRLDPDEPHLPCRPPEQESVRYDSTSILPWPSFSDRLEGKPVAQGRQHEVWGTRSWTWSDWQPVVARYLAEVSLIDQQVGRLLAQLAELGIADETLVIYSSDHGDYCGGHGLLDKHYAMYDDLVRVPLIMRFPGRLQKGQTCDAFVCNEIDLARTIARVAGLGIPDSFVGQDLLDLANGREEARSDIFAQYSGCQMGLYSSRMVRDRDWKYVWNPTADHDELYDLKSDPGELRNLINLPSATGQVTRQRRRLITWMKEINDPLFSAFTRSRLDLRYPAPPPVDWYNHSEYDDP